MYSYISIHRYIYEYLNMIINVFLRSVKEKHKINFDDPMKNKV